MYKRRGRTLEELYNVTEDIAEPGGVMHESKVEETVCEVQKDTVR
jgi:hypothetical protein